MKKTVVFLVSGLSAFVFIGCASTPANLQRETARSIGNLTSDQVTVSDIKRGATMVTWIAKSPKGVYKCEADDMVRRVNCVKK